MSRKNNIKNIIDFILNVLSIGILAGVVLILILMIIQTIGLWNVIIPVSIGLAIILSIIRVIALISK